MISLHHQALPYRSFHACLWAILSCCFLIHCGNAAQTAPSELEESSMDPETQPSASQTPNEPIGTNPNRMMLPPAPKPPTLPPVPPPVQGDTFANYIDGQMEMYCRDCHVASFLTADSVTMPSRRVLQRIETGNMPPRNSPQIPQADKIRIRAWFDAGSPP